ncbi:hypothetical protein SCB49_01829 [unidentified eubacterium SCB49]|nr:hypothetical protein SCB49_01829 [unidentified eubacterium SCB49]
MVYAQIQQPPAEKFDQYFNEVFTGEGATYYSPESTHFKKLKKMYENRIHFTTYDAATIEAKGFDNLTSVPLNTVYNKGLQRDTEFDINSFNPLKYYFDYHTRATQIFVLGNTNTVMVIYPQSITQQ